MDRAKDFKQRSLVRYEGRVRSGPGLSLILLSTEVPMLFMHDPASGFPRPLAQLLVVLVGLGTATLALSQNPATPQQQPQPPAQPDQATPDGGPAGDNGPIALPKKKEQPEDTPPPAPVAPKVKNPEGAGNYSLRIEVPEVTVDVGVILEKTHQFVPGLKPNNFKVFEDGVEQKIAGFKRVEAPITALMLCEFAGSNYTYAFNYDMLNAVYSFANQLRPQDYVALMTFDMRTQIVTDFTQDKRQIYDAINTLRVPGFNERNLF